MKFKIEAQASVVPQYSHIQRNKRNETHCIFSIQTNPLDEKEKRPPLALACVLDKSGSMSGSKIKWSKRAIRKIIKHLRPEDTLHFITYDTFVQVVFQNGDLSDKDSLTAKVKGVYPGSCTNISGGLAKAHEILTKEKHEEGTIKRIFLFSDGNANEGIRDKKEMFKFVSKMLNDGVTTSAFGIGNDFDEEMMKGIATAGKGRYLFLEGESSITQKVSKAIHGLLGLLGTNGFVEFFCPKKGCKISKIYGRDSLENFEIGDVYADNKKNILLKFDIETAEKDDEIEVCQYTFTYDSKKAKGKVNLKGVIKFKLSDDEKVCKGMESTMVKVAIMVQHASIINAEIAELIRKNKRNDAIEKKKKLNLQLEKLVNEDETKKIAKLLEKGKNELIDMQNKSSSMELMAKKISYESYKCCEDEDFEYASGTDSDCGNYSDDESNGLNKKTTKFYNNNNNNNLNMVYDSEEEDDETDDDDIELE